MFAVVACPPLLQVLPLLLLLLLLLALPKSYFYQLRFMLSSHGEMSDAFILARCEPDVKAIRCQCYVGVERACNVDNGCRQQAMQFKTIDLAPGCWAARECWARCPGLRSLSLRAPPSVACPFSVAGQRLSLHPGCPQQPRDQRQLAAARRAS